MTVARLVAIGVASASSAAMAYVGAYQVGAVKKMVCPILGGGCEKVADAPFARPLGLPDGFIALALYALMLVLLAAPIDRPWVRPVLLALGLLATAGNALGVHDMMQLRAFCFYCLLTTLLSPALLWAVWMIG